MNFGLWIDCGKWLITVETLEWVRWRKCASQHYTEWAFGPIRISYLGDYRDETA